jgi:hypothetical protein
MRVQDGLLFEVPEHASARDQKPAPEVAIAAAKAEADAVKAGADADTAAAVATVAALAATPSVPTPDVSERGEPFAAGQVPAHGADAPSEQAPPAEVAAEAAERERLRREVEEARQREREAIAARDRLAAEAEAARLAEEERRKQDAEHAAEHERASVAEKARHQEEERLRKEMAAEAATEAAAEAERLETQRVWIAGEVERLKGERRQLEKELRVKRDESAGTIDPSMFETATSGASAKGTDSTAARGPARKTGTMGAAAGGGATAGRSAKVGTQSMPKRNPRSEAWMATRQTPNRAAAFARGFLAGTLLVGSLTAIYLFANKILPPPEDTNTWDDWWAQRVGPVVLPVLGLALFTIILASFGGMLIELLLPPLRAPARDPSRWLVVFVLGITLGPVSFILAWNLLDLSKTAGNFDPLGVVLLSALAFLAAELWLARGSRSRSSSN